MARLSPMILDKEHVNIVFMGHSWAGKLAQTHGRSSLLCTAGLTTGSLASLGRSCVGRLFWFLSVFGFDEGRTVQEQDGRGSAVQIRRWCSFQDDRRLEMPSPICNLNPKNLCRNATCANNGHRWSHFPNEPTRARYALRVMKSIVYMSHLVT